MIAFGNKVSANEIYSKLQRDTPNDCIAYDWGSEDHLNSCSGAWPYVTNIAFLFGVDDQVVVINE